MVKQILIKECRSEKEANELLSEHLDILCDRNGDIYPLFKIDRGEGSMTLRFNEPHFADVYVEWPGE